MHWLSLSPVLIIVLAIVGLVFFDAFSEDYQRSKLTIASLGLVSSIGILSYNIFSKHHWVDSIDNSVIKISPFSIIISISICCIGLFLIIGSHDEIKNINKSYGIVLAMILTTVTGVCLLSMSADFLMLFVSIECVSMPIMMLVFWSKTKEQAKPAVMYFLYSVATSSFMLFGISFIFAKTNSLAISSIFEFSSSLLIKLGLLFILIAIFFKAAIFPLQGWVLGVYSNAPVFVANILSVISKFAAMIVLILLFSSRESLFNKTFLVLGITTMALGAFAALRSQTFVQLLAYSSIINSGVMVVAFGIDKLELKIIVQYLIIYSLSTMAAFISMYGSRSSNQKFNFAIIASLFSLAGILPLAGWYPKFLIMKNALIDNKSTGFVITLSILFSSLAAFVAYGKFIRKTINFESQTVNKDSESEVVVKTVQDLYVSTTSLLVANILSIAILIIGIYPRIIEYIVEKL